MGLLDKIFNKSDKRKSAMPARREVPYMNQWPIEMPKYEILVSGDMERQIYVYDSSPLKGIRKGQVVKVELFRGTGAMVSTATGFFKDMEGTKDCIVLYDGRPIGFIAFPADKLKRAAEMGYAIKMNARCYGALEGYKGIKEMRALVPQLFYLRDWIPGAEDDRPLWQRENYMKYNEYDATDYRNLTSNYEWDFPNAKIAMIPTPEGSQAKPHIGLYAQNGMQISEVSARNGCYKDLITFMNKYKTFHIKATRVISEYEEKIYYTIEILGD